MSMSKVPRPDRRRQAPKTILLSLEMASTWRQRRAPQVITFIGTLAMIGNEGRGNCLLYGQHSRVDQFLPEPVHHVCSVGFRDDLASEGKKLPLKFYPRNKV